MAFHYSELIFSSKECWMNSTSNFNLLFNSKQSFIFSYSTFPIHFSSIYKHQDQGKSYSTVEELFADACPSFLPYFNTSSKFGFSKFANLNDRAINELVEASLRVNYGQSISVPLFVGKFQFLVYSVQY